MCLILLAYDTHPDYRLILAANRDEFYERPTAPLEFWEDTPDILAGRDLKASGTWLGVSRKCRLAAITNYRDPATIMEVAPSRGDLVSGFLKSEIDPQAYLKNLQKDAARYNGFNLLVGDQRGLFYYGNHSAGIEKIEPGVHGLSNHLLNTPWPKVEKGQAALEALISDDGPIEIEYFFDILADRSLPSDDSLPDTGVGLEWERMLSPLFIESKDYGTRSSSVICINHEDRIDFWERTFRVSDGKVKDHRTRHLMV
jgi:uncharacterized protein with NRDE domain